MESPQTTSVKRRPGSTSMKERRNRDLKNRFQELYDGQRLRLDDVKKMLSQEFYISIPYVERILSK